MIIDTRTIDSEVIIMGYTIGMPSIKLSNIDGKGGKHCGNFRKVAAEALKERQGLDNDINPELAARNIYIGYDTAEKLIAYSNNHINELNAWRAEHGERVCDRRKLKKDTVVMCATVIKPPAEMMSKLAAEQQQMFLQDSLDIFKGFVGEENIKAAAFHFDERVPHLHIFWEPMTDEHRICAKEMHSLKFFATLNREMPKHLREKGWSMVDDCQAYDKIEEQQKRLEMGADQYRAYRKAKKANRGRDSRVYKHDVEQQIAQEQQYLIQVQNVRQSEQQAAIVAQLKREAEEQHSETLRKKAKKAYNVVVLAREEAKKTKEELEMQQQILEQEKNKFRLQIEEYNQRINEIAQIRLEYFQIKDDFLNYVKDEMKKIKSETIRNDIAKRINSNIQSRAELTAELDLYVDSVIQKSKSKERGFTL